MSAVFVEPVRQIIIGLNTHPKGELSQADDLKIGNSGHVRRLRYSEDMRHFDRGLLRTLKYDYGSHLSKASEAEQ